jgi:hypothetical protein
VIPFQVFLFPLHHFSIIDYPGINSLCFLVLPVPIVGEGSSDGESKAIQSPVTVTTPISSEARKAQLEKRMHIAKEVLFLNCICNIS